MSDEQEKKGTSVATTMKAILFMIILIIIVILGACYYPIFKDRINNTLAFQPKTSSESLEDLSESTLPTGVDTFKGVDLKDKQIAVFNYLNQMVYSSEDENSIEIKDKKQGYVFRDQDGVLKAAFLGDAWYSMEILPIDPIADDPISTPEGETPDVK